MIFELVHGQESDPDYAYKLITLPTKDYRHEEKLNPISPIARKVTRARYVSMMLEAFSIAKPVDRNDDHLMLRLLRQNDGHLLGEAVTIIDELKLREADQVWRWLCNNLSCFRDDNSCLPADNQILSLPIQDLINKLQKIFEDQIGNNHQLIDRCLVSPEESTASYSWIPLICEMATNVPTTFWLRDFCWYVPNHYDSQRRILQNGKWLVNEPKPEDLPDPTLKPINLGSLAHHLGPAPAAGVCTVAGYVSTCFNLLEFFYTWLGTCSHSQQMLLEILKQSRLPFQEDEFQQLEELPYALRNKVWRLLKQDEKQECLPQHTLDVLHLLEYPLNRRNGLPDAYCAGQAED